MRTVTVAGLLAVAVLLGGCSGDSGRGEGTTPLSAAVNRIQKQVGSSSSYAGAEIDKRNERIIVYRKPDPKLDETVRGITKGTEVEFRDAPYSRQDLLPISSRVDADNFYWSERDIKVRVAQPRADGIGVNVLVETADLASARAAFAERYGRLVIVALPTPGAIQPA